MSLQDDALALVRLGFRVFPLEPGTKRPFPGSRGVKDATDDPGRVREWWQICPNANIGVAGAPDLLIVDLDVKGGADGVAEFAKLLGREDATDGDWVRYNYPWGVETPSGGLHLYHRPEGALGSTVGKLGPGIDTRGCHGYVVGPGSIVGGKKYQWKPGAHEGPMPQLPEAIEAKLLAAGEREVGADRLPKNFDHPRMQQRAVEFLKQAVMEDNVAVEGAGGDHLTYEIACRLREMALSPETVEGLMAEYWNPHCSPPWSVEDLGDKVRNAFAYAQNRVPEPFGGLLIDEIVEDARQGPSKFKYSRRYSEFKGMPDPEWIVDRVLQEDTLGLLYGKTGAAKTFVALDLALSLATGRTWIGGRDQIEPAPVHYLAFESPTTVRQRACAWAELHGESLELIEKNFLLGMDLRKVRDEEFLRDICYEIKTHKPRLVVVDTFQYAAGAIEENASKDMVDVLNHLAPLRKAADRACTLIVHHSTKTGDTARGAGHLIQAMDTILRVSEVHHGWSSVAVEKSRSSERPKDPWHWKANRVAVDDDTRVVFHFTPDAPPKEPTQKEKNAKTKSDERAIDSADDSI